MAKRANAKTVEVNSSHVAYMSHWKETAKLIEEAGLRARQLVAIDRYVANQKCVLRTR